MRIIIGLIFWCCIVGRVFSQTVEEYPVATGLSFMSQEFYNPAALHTSETFEGNVLHRGNFGVFNDVATTYAQFTLNLSGPSDSSSGNQRFLGLYAESDREGQLLSRNRGYLQFSQQLSISENWSLQLGAMMGGVNLIFRSTSITPGVSAAAMDGAAGIRTTYLKRYTLGLAVSQMFNAQLTSINQVTRLQRFFSVYTDVEVLKKRNLKGNFYGRMWYGAGDIIAADGGMYTKVLQYLRAGIGYRAYHGGLIHLGLDEIRIGGGRAVILSSFEFPFISKSQLPHQSYELTLMYYL